MPNGGIAPPFLTSALDGDQWPASRPGLFTLRERSLSTRWTRICTYRLLNCFQNLSYLHRIKNPEVLLTSELSTVVQCMAPVLLVWSIAVSSHIYTWEFNYNAPHCFYLFMQIPKNSNMLFGNDINKSNYAHEVKSTLDCKNYFCDSIYNLLSSRILVMNLKIKTDKSIIFPDVLDGCETWSFILRVEYRF
jgi:hypothetical protein